MLLLDEVTGASVRGETGFRQYKRIELLEDSTRIALDIIAFLYLAN